MKTLILDIWGDYGHFKVPYTTTSPLTFPIPPKTALYGMIGAVFGYAKDEYCQRLNQDRWQFGIQIVRPIKKTHISENLLHTKNVKWFARMDPEKPPHSPTRIEFLKDPGFRLFIQCGNTAELERLAHILQDRSNVYTLSLGLSECLLTYNFRGTIDTRQISETDEWMKLDSVLPLNLIKNREDIQLFQPEGTYQRIHIPLELSSSRVLLASEYFLIEAGGKPISIRNLSFLQLELDSQSIRFVLF